MGYYKLTFNNCSGVDYAFTVVPLEGITEYVNMAGLESKDQDGPPSIVISYLNWTDEKYNEWLEKHVHL